MSAASDDRSQTQTLRLVRIAIIVGIQGVFNHANVQISFGPLARWLVTPQFHHWHHAADEDRPKRPRPPAGSPDRPRRPSPAVML